MDYTRRGYTPTGCDCEALAMIALLSSRLGPTAKNQSLIDLNEVHSLGSFSFTWKMEQTHVSQAQPHEACFIGHTVREMRISYKYMFCSLSHPPLCACRLFCSPALRRPSGSTSSPGSRRRSTTLSRAGPRRRPSRRP